ncbi:COG2192 Predicted carbamoyl transferase, NodU family [uncultured Caudovirales phage]|uniref:COG2192 Predicted carbamoyl transferase, NodU family n=1 Tax=uncultured Caudovirales phage TaxID=2100421 RepID=A0A6J5L5P4_9CAUD|nr:COG2192 Predicted carbamoyl transferase, NodU family [uncultured Caudovirales phage]
MSILGISAGFHDAAATVINDRGEILFAGHSERYSKIKNDPDIHIDLIAELGQYNIDHVAYYETPWKKQLRQLYSGQGIEWNKLTTKRILNKQLQGFFTGIPISTHSHHLSHAAAGFQTSTFNRATVVVIDAIGEWDTISIWGAHYNNGVAKYHRLWGQQYPHSIGLFYTAMTQQVGLKPMEDEYILMGMSAYGSKQASTLMKMQLVDNEHELTFKENLHTGASWDYAHHFDAMDVASSAQALCENLIYNVMRRAKDFGWSKNLVYMGGVALNCLANRNLGDYFENIWIMPNPGDAGSSLGAAALTYGKRISFDNAFLGYKISGNYPVNAILDSLLADKITGVASGRAEFGPRALGNRSLLADPRGPDIKDRVNAIKRRQEFRPFAPVILEEHARDYFNMPGVWSDSRYMQIVGTCLQPDLFPAIVHHDGTSRIQTVPKDGSGIRELLEKWYVVTGCPMLLNTSLNIKGEPMVNDRADADRFEQRYGVKVHS